MSIETVKIVKILPTKIWIESGSFGQRAVVLQHEGCDPFDYAVFGYDYRYTSNAGTWQAANNLALSLGATDPIEQRHRYLPPMPTADELREQIVELTAMLADIDLQNKTENPAPKSAV